MSNNLTILRKIKRWDYFTEQQLLDMPKEPMWVWDLLKYPDLERHRQSCLDVIQFHTIGMMYHDQGELLSWSCNDIHAYQLTDPHPYTDCKQIAYWGYGPADQWGEIMIQPDSFVDITGPLWIDLWVSASRSARQIQMDGFIEGFSKQFAIDKGNYLTFMSGS